MCKCAYVGKRRIVKDIGHPEYAEWFVENEFDESGKPNFVDAEDR